MSRSSEIRKKVNETLDSLEGIQRVEPGSFFFTRVMARLEREERNIWELTGSFISRPAVAIAGLFLILCINAFILFERSPATIDQSSLAIQAVPVEEYALTADNSNYDYENTEP
jgi:hypothetical protein